MTASTELLNFLVASPTETATLYTVVRSHPLRGVGVLPPCTEIASSNTMGGTEKKRARNNSRQLGCLAYVMRSLFYSIFADRRQLHRRLIPTSRKEVRRTFAGPGLIGERQGQQMANLLR